MKENMPMPETPSRSINRATPTLRFSPTAWAKLVYLRDLGATEVGGFALSAADDLLFVRDVVMVRQHCTSVTVTLDDHAVADFFDEQIEAGLKSEQFCRIWVHTHPGNSPTPSTTDEKTFARVFGPMDWAMMFILAEGGQTYARLRFNVGPGGEMLVPVSVDYAIPFAGSDHARWMEEYTAHLVDEDRLARDAFEHRSGQAAASCDRECASVAHDLRQFADPFYDPFREGWDDQEELLWEEIAYEY